MIYARQQIVFYYTQGKMASTIMKFLREKAIIISRIHSLMKLWHNSQGNFLPSSAYHFIYLSTVVKFSAF